MDLIIGGAYQGKCTFAAEKYGLAAEDICDLAVSPGRRTRRRPFPCCWRRRQ